MLSIIAFKFTRSVDARYRLRSYLGTTFEEVTSLHKTTASPPLILSQAGKSQPWDKSVTNLEPPFTLVQTVSTQ